MGGSQYLFKEISYFSDWKKKIKEWSHVFELCYSLVSSSLWLITLDVMWMQAYPSFMILLVLVCVNMTQINGVFFAAGIEWLPFCLSTIEGEDYVLLIEISSLNAFIVEKQYCKAFDLLDWTYLDNMNGENVWFHMIWRGWISDCLRTTLVSVLINDSSTKEFSVGKGLRQGDPFECLWFLDFVSSEGGWWFSILLFLICFVFEIKIDNSCCKKFSLNCLLL